MELKIERTEDYLFVIRLFRVPVNWDRTFEEEIRLSGPQTPSNHPIWRAGSEYPKPAGKAGVELFDISLIGYNRPWKAQEAENYLYRRRSLVAASAHQVLAIGEAYPRELGYLWMRKGFQYRDSIGVASLQRSAITGQQSLPGLWFDSGPGSRVAKYFVGQYCNEDIWIAVLGIV